MKFEKADVVRYDIPRGRVQKVVQQIDGLDVRVEGRVLEGKSIVNKSSDEDTRVGLRAFIETELSVESIALRPVNESDEVAYEHENLSGEYKLTMIGGPDPFVKVFRKRSDAVSEDEHYKLYTNGQG